MTTDYGTPTDADACAAGLHSPSNELKEYGKATSDWLCQCGRYIYKAEPAPK